MKEELIEYFHGNNREIENEKQRKRELMSHFPKTLGTVDETRYVLHDDEKQKQTDYFKSKPVSPLTVAPAKMSHCSTSVEYVNSRARNLKKKRVCEQRYTA
jgi:hypothetical protein